MDNQSYNAIVSFIWGITDDCLRDVYVRGKYRDVILPMTVIRRLDAMLEGTKQAVLDMKKTLDAAHIDLLRELSIQDKRKRNEVQIHCKHEHGSRWLSLRWRNSARFP